MPIEVPQIDTSKLQLRKIKRVQDSLEEKAEEVSPLCIFVHCVYFHLCSLLIIKLSFSRIFWIVLSNVELKKNKESLYGNLGCFQRIV